MFMDFTAYVTLVDYRFKTDQKAANIISAKIYQPFKCSSILLHSTHQKIHHLPGHPFKIFAAFTLKNVAA
jgi:hypothetical protein